MYAGVILNTWRKLVKTFKCLSFIYSKLSSIAIIVLFLMLFVSLMTESFRVSIIVKGCCCCCLLVSAFKFSRCKYRPILDRAACIIHSYAFTSVDTLRKFLFLLSVGHDCRMLAGRAHK